jgi:hypothetical protein
MSKNEVRDSLAIGLAVDRDDLVIYDTVQLDTMLSRYAEHFINLDGLELTDGFAVSPEGVLVRDGVAITTRDAVQELGATVILDMILDALTRDARADVG